MVARGEKSRCQSPCFNVHVELDNRALKTKNTGLTQAVAKLQQENAELLKQITLLQEESFEINSRYNNLRNVTSIIDSTTKSCLSKLTDVVDTFTGIIQLCSVASNISNSNRVRDTRTQAVKPQIVNGHVLHNPTITLSRLGIDNFSIPSTSQASSNVTVNPSSNRTSIEPTSNNDYLNSNEEETSNENENVDNTNGDGEQDSSFVCKATRGVCKRKKSSINMDVSTYPEDDSESSDDEMEMPITNEEDVGEEDQEQLQIEERLTTIQEDEEDDEEIPTCLSPRTRQCRFLKGRLQEVRIYLNQLPNTSVDQFSGPGNISISVTPPERRSSFKQRSSSLFGEVNETLKDNSHSFLDEKVSPLSRSLKVPHEDSNFSDSSTINGNSSKLRVTFGSPMPSSSFETSDTTDDGRMQFGDSISVIHNVPSPSNSRTSINNTMHVKSPLIQSNSVGRKINENSHNRSGTYNSPNKSPNNDHLIFKTNITKRRVSSREKRKVAQVLLDRLSLDKRLSKSPLKGIKDIVNTPPITKVSEIKSQVQNSKKINKRSRVNSNKNNLEDIEESKAKTAKRKKDSPTKKLVFQKETFIKPKVKTSPKKSPGRPKRTARPKSLKEPTLNKKMRRSK